MRIVVDCDLCTGCESCISSCPYDAIVMEDDKAFINEYCQNCRACLTVCPEGAIKEEETAADIAAREESAERIESHKGVWVFAEQRDGKVADVALELLNAGRRLAEARNTDVTAVLLGADESEAKRLIHWGADSVYHSDDPIFEHFNDEPYVEALTRLITEAKPEIVLTGATPVGRSFFPRVATRIQAGLTADCTSLDIDSETGNLLQVRPAFGGNIMATIVCPNHRPQMATVRPRVMKKGEMDEGRNGEITKVPADGLSSRTRVVETVKEVSGTSVNLQEADTIVAGGRGVGSAEGFKLLEELASILDGAVGATRAAVDEEWISYSHQVGQTGKTVCPKVYIACGISGAVQHLVGMQSSDIIIAINKNHEAPIFGVANFEIVGDYADVLPVLIRKIKEAKGL